MRPLKKYELRAARRPKVHPLLSGVAHVADRDGTGHAYFSFSDEFVTAVGQSLVYGLLPEHPAYVKVLYMATRRSWRVFAYYLIGGRGVLLWEQPTCPDWISNVVRR